MPHLRVVITDCDLGSTDVEEQILRDTLGPDTEVLVAQCRTPQDVLAVGRDADALIVQWAPVPAEVIHQLERCRLISRYGIGVDMIDVRTAQARGIEVRNVPHYCTEEVATHAVSLLLALWRRLPQLDRSVRSGEWSAMAVAGTTRRLSGATLGLVGMGRIATLVAEVFAAFGTTVLAYDPFATPVDGIEFVPLAELATRADLVSLHCPLTEQTRNLVGAELLALLPDGAVLVNTARGGLVDVEALVAALSDGRLAGAGLDVFATEPLSMHSPLRTAPNLLLGPHAAWCSAEALPSLQAEAARNVTNYFAAGPASGS